MHDLSTLLNAIQGTFPELASLLYDRAKFLKVVTLSEVFNFKSYVY